jgi:hypothetical protein
VIDLTVIICYYSYVALKRGATKMNTQTQKPQYVIAMGNAFYGIDLYGPFADPAIAIAWAEENNSDKREWQLITVFTP